MVNAAHHPWVLAGPWYRWDKPGLPAAGRVSRPALQKYETTRFVKEFQLEPQHSLKFLDPEDFVREVQPRFPTPLPEGTIRDRLSDNNYVSTGMRKLFLDFHKRYYLVVCELHCDMPGFPSADRRDVCEAGFVVRRRVADVPPAVAGATSQVVRQMSLASAQIAQIDELPAGRKTGPLATARAAAAIQLQNATAELQGMVKANGIRVVLQGWIPGPFEKIGHWQEVPEMPQAVDEDILPLHPLIPDPRLKQHTAAGRTLYFGVVPTGSADHDPAGNARYEDQSLYEIRCFVRRHRPPCPRKRERNDCHGELTWSQRTETYRVASHFDLDGTSNLPVTIQLPDIPALQAQVASLPVGRGTPVKMISPPGSPDFTVNTDTLKIKLNKPIGQICSFSIPLITIVATFVLKLFLPVVILALQLFFLLKLKFCIPPTVSLKAGGSVSANVTAGLVAAFDAKLEAGFAAGFTADVEAEVATGLATDFSASLAPEIHVDAPPKGVVSLPQPLPSTTANLAFEAHVEVKPA